MSSTPTRDELAAEVHQLAGRVTAAVSELHGLVVNNCLATQTIKLTAAGATPTPLDWRVPFGSVAVHNGGNGPLTISTDSQGDPANPPTTGQGVAVIPAGVAAVVNLAGRTLALYGPAGARVVLSVFTTPQPPSWANLGVLP